jgi:phage terminase small subunit
MREAQDTVKKQGSYIKDRFGQLRPHPALQVERDAKGVLLRHLKALGLDLEPINDTAGRPPGK